MAAKHIGRGVRSARGVEVDFDLLRIKENLNSSPKGTTVKAREDFIDNKLRRRIRRLAEAAPVIPPAPPAAPTADIIEDAPEPTPVSKKRPIAKTTTE